ncbi:uncharacterized protein DUF5130 [Motilibacter peucedani]|uniref:Uncharacterized protein DUF5130 n=1 Tax=Motilibacter peucedani TaxID=598650 RepID=A0A420XNR6_9ACTN|nr:DUF5130 family protein [Motilibacter peucedani]RKS73812.1 uncharacterized protein DUF5130 [Motilibacter peucedani]
MAPGEPFRDRHRQQIERARAEAADRYGLPVAVFVGTVHSRASAEAMLARLGPEAAETVLVAVDPASRRVEVVTGAAARSRVDDRVAALVTLSMTASFAVGDLAGGIALGVRMLGEHAGRARR